MRGSGKLAARPLRSGSNKLALPKRPRRPSILVPEANGAMVMDILLVRVIVSAALR
jgi:hypothetical protein